MHLTTLTYTLQREHISLTKNKWILAQEINGKGPDEGNMDDSEAPRDLLGAEGTSALLDEAYAKARNVRLTGFCLLLLCQRES